MFLGLTLISMFNNILVYSNMQVILNPDGTRNRDFRPYIEEEEQSNSVYLYSPNGPGFHYGLYETGGQPSCGSWLGIYDQYPSKIPIAIIGATGREHLVKPYWNRYGYHYQPLLEHTITN